MDIYTLLKRAATMHTYINKKEKFFETAAYEINMANARYFPVCRCFPNVLLLKDCLAKAPHTFEGAIPR